MASMTESLTIVDALFPRASAVFQFIQSFSNSFFHTLGLMFGTLILQGLSDMDENVFHKIGVMAIRL